MTTYQFNFTGTTAHLLLGANSIYKSLNEGIINYLIKKKLNG